MSNTYYCKGNLKHNGRLYKRGDAVELDQQSAEELMGIKVVQSQPIPEEELEPEISDEQKQVEPEVGGDVLKEMGEPSMDGPDQPVQKKTGFLGKVFGGSSNTDEQKIENKEDTNSDNVSSDGNVGDGTPDQQNDPSVNL